VTVAETLALIRELRFASPPYRKRIDVIFQNPDTDSKLGSYVAGFNPADAVVICSFQEEFTQLRASTLVRAALQSFSAIDKGTQPDWNRRQVTLFWAYGSGRPHSPSIVAAPNFRMRSNPKECGRVKGFCIPSKLPNPGSSRLTKEPAAEP
jgi:hypothetical protein